MASRFKRGDPGFTRPVAINTFSSHTFDKYNS